MIVASSEFQQKVKAQYRETVNYFARVYNTKLAVPSLGISFEVISGGTLAEGTIPNLSLFWGESTPFSVPEKNSYTVDFDGYFNAEKSGTLKFFFAGDTDLNSFSCNTGSKSNQLLRHDSESYLEVSCGSVTQSSWYSFSLNITHIRMKHRVGGITVLYKIIGAGESEADLPYRILNAGVFNTTNSWQGNFDIRIQKGSGDMNNDSTSSYKITIPLVDNQYEVSETEPYAIYDVINDDHIKINSLIKVYVGYKVNDPGTAQNETTGIVEDGIEYIPRFTGLVHDFELSRDGKTIEIEIRDFMSLMETDINRNYPDPSSYWQFNYLKEYEARKPNGRLKPIAYDRFQINDTIVDIGVKAGIPASLFYKNKIYKKSASGTVSIPSVFENDFILDCPPDYYRMTPDTEFVFKYDFGEYLINIFNKLLELYGYNGFFDGDGKFIFQPKSAPLKIFDNKDATGSGSEYTSINAMGGTYTEVDASNNLTFNSVYSRSIGLIIKRGTGYGNSDINSEYDPYTGTPNIRVRIYDDDNGSPGNLLQTTDLNGYYYTTWEFLMGTDPTTGKNPCLIHITDLPIGFDIYHVVISRLGKVIEVDGLFAYKDNVGSPIYTFRTDEDISKLKYKFGMSTIRNDVVVVGRNKGVWIQGKVQQNVEAINAKKNVIYQNIYYRATDFNSAYNPNSTRWMGRRNTLIAISDEVVSVARAKELAISVLDSLKDPTMNLQSHSIAGNPLIEPGDVIRLIDVHGFYIDVMVKQVNEMFESGKWEHSFAVYPYKNLVSYMEFPAFDWVNDFNNQRVIDFNTQGQIEATDGYGKTRPYFKGALASNYSGGTSMTLTDASSLPNTGVVILNDISDSNWCAFLYTSKAGNVLTGSLQYESDTGHTYTTDNTEVYAGYNCYEFDETGNLLSFKFYSLGNFIVRAGIKSKASGMAGKSWIATFTGGFENGVPVPTYFGAGELIEFKWDGIDETGLSHRSDDLFNDKPKNFFSQPDEYFLQLEIEDLETGNIYTDVSKYLGIQLSRESEAVFQFDSHRNDSYFYADDNGRYDVCNFLESGDETQWKHPIFFPDEDQNFILDVGMSPTNRPVRTLIDAIFYQCIYPYKISNSEILLPKINAYQILEKEYPWDDAWKIKDGDSIEINFADGNWGALDLSGYFYSVAESFHNDPKVGDRRFFMGGVLVLNLQLFDKSGRRIINEATNTPAEMVYKNGDVISVSMLVYPGYYDSGNHNVSEYSWTIGSNSYSLSYQNYMTGFYYNGGIHFHNLHPFKTHPFLAPFWKIPVWEIVRT